MNPMAAHRINILEIELVTGEVALAEALIGRIGQLHERRIAPTLDRVFSELSGPDRLDRIDRLEIDLGDISVEQFDDDLVRKLEAAVRSALHRALDGRPRDDRSAPPRELLTIFARTGNLPWWAARSETADPVAAAMLTLSLAPHELLALLRELADDPLALTRLARHCDDSTLAPLVTHRWPAGGELLAAARWLADALHEPPVRPLVRRALLAALVRPGTDTPAALRELLLDLAGALDLSAQALIKRLERTAPPHDLPPILRELQPPRSADTRALAAEPPAGPASTTCLSEHVFEDIPSTTSPEVHQYRQQAVQRAEGLARDAAPPSAREDTAASGAARLEFDAPVASATAEHAPSAPPIDRDARPAELPSTAEHVASDMTPETPDDGRPDRSADARAAAPHAAPADALRRPGARASDATRERADASTTRESPDLAAPADAPRQPGARARDASRERVDASTGGSPDLPAHAPRQRSPSGSPPRPPLAPPRDDVQTARRRALAALDELYVEDAGLVILWPFLARFFARVGLLDDQRRFLDEPAQMRAIALLSWLALEDPAPPEFCLPLAKLLCGLAPEAAFAQARPLAPELLAEGERLLAAVVDHAPVLRDMSVAGLRAAFLRRPAALCTRDGAWLLRVERRAHDVVLERFPWAWSWLKLPWMPDPMRVEW